MTSIATTLHESGDLTDEALIMEQHSARTTGTPAVDKLLKHMNKFGTDMIRESALHLPEEEFTIVDEACSRYEAAQERKRKEARYS